MKQTTILIFSKMINSAYGIFISWERNKVAQQMLIIFFYKCSHIFKFTNQNQNCPYTHVYYIWKLENKILRFVSQILNLLFIF